MAQFGEFELIAAIRERLAGAGAASGAGVVLGAGDDAAISARRGVSVTSVDALVEDVGFRLGQFAPAEVGRKALAVALSDLAAMGAAPREAYVQLGVRDGLGDEELLAVADGVAEVAAAHGVTIAGGDVVRAPALLLAITVVGEARSAESLVRRSGASAGELLVVSGELGGAAAGLALLERPELGERLDRGAAEALRGRQLAPEPRLAAGAALAEAGATAMIDLSDGLAADAAHLARASGVRARIEARRLPAQAGVAQIADALGVEPLSLIAAGGEDYELLAALPAGRLATAAAALAGLDLGLTEIGALEPGEGVELSGAPGGAAPAGFDQLRGRRAPGEPA